MAKQIFTKHFAAPWVVDGTFGQGRGLGWHLEGFHKRLRSLWLRS